MRRIYLWIPAIIIVLFSFFLLLSVLTLPVITRTNFTEVKLTSTPDASAILNQAQDATNQAQALNTDITLALTFFGAVLAALTLASGALAFFGFTSMRDINKIKEEMSEDLKDMRKIRGALVYLNIGDSLMHRNAINDAMANYRKAGEFLPKDPEINYILGRIYSRAGYSGDAINTLKRVVDANPNSAEGHRELGLAYRRRGTQTGNMKDFDEAISHLEEATRLNNKDDDAYCITGGLYRRKHDYQQALIKYQQAYNVNSKSSYATGNIASLKWHFNEIAEAKKRFEETEILTQQLITSGKPEGYWNYYDLALSHLMLGKPDALTRYKEAIDETPHPRAETIEGVLDNLYVIRDADATKTNPISQLAEVITFLETIKNNP